MEEAGNLLDLVGIPQEAIAKALDGTSAESQYLIQLNAAAYRKAHPGSTVGRAMSIEVGKAEPRVLDAVKEDVAALKLRVGKADQLRLDVDDLEALGPDRSLAAVFEDDGTTPDPAR